MTSHSAWGHWLVLLCTTVVCANAHATRPYAAGGWKHSYILGQDGLVRSTGSNIAGQLGDGTNRDSEDHFVTVLATNVHDIVQIASGAFHGLALRADGTVWAWGENFSGQLGDGSKSDSNVPVKATASGFAGIVAIAASRGSSYAIDAMGRLWVWGDNNAGQLGDGTTAVRVTPARLTSIAGVVAVAPAHESVLALL